MRDQEAHREQEREEREPEPVSPEQRHGLHHADPGEGRPEARASLLACAIRTAAWRPGRRRVRR
jgi:hypothetical protein